MERRVFAVAAAAALMALAPTTAPAESTGNSVGTGLVVAITGAVNKVPATGTLKIHRFEVVGTGVNAVGTLSLTNRVGKSAIAAVSVPLVLPASNVAKSSVSEGKFVSAEAQAQACEILSLTLGPLHLDLLGLVIDLNQVELDIVAQPGPGNLLGNLLCAVVNLLNNVNLGSLLQQLVNALNALIAAL